MILFRVLIVFLIPLLVAGLAVAQIKEISKEQYSGTYFAAIEKAQSLARRETTKTKRLRDGQVIEEEGWILEYDLSFRSRLVYSTRAPKISRTAMIVSEDKIFCKFEAGPWKLVDRLCLTGPIFNQVLGIVSSKYSVQDTIVDNKRVQLFREYVTHKSPTNKGDGLLRFMETKFWLNEKGLILNRHVTVGVVGSETISFEDVYSFEYDPPGLKIEVPIP